MEPDDSRTESRFSLYTRPVYWAIAVALLVATLTGCLTSHAAGPVDEAQAPSPTIGLALYIDASPVSATPTPGLTLVPNTALRPLQQATSTNTATATATATPTATPGTATATLTPSATAEPTDTQQPTATATATPRPTDTPRPTAPPTTPSPFQAYAWVDNYYPAPGTAVTVHGSLSRNGRPVNGAQMGVTWGYTHGKAYCSAYTGIEGRAACALNIGWPLPGYWVFIDVVFVYEDQLYYAKTAFLTDP